MCEMKTKDGVPSLFSHWSFRLLFLYVGCVTGCFVLVVALYFELLFIKPEDRPIGVKAAKAASKRKKTGKDEELTKLEGPMEIKKQISRQILLESLLAKPEPLSDMELALKTKLLISKDMCEMKTKA
ncbi:hypothetical protein F2Q70_00044723 [Brassica cretica]|uniref:Uncharacterized protein n=1 Tax=Brassica cretica TaxID=69181 RepID=A0A8S9KHB4_BRACR|nr:hypothetical protein F2Q70_00044723 [Brassica cretica]